MHRAIAALVCHDHLGSPRLMVDVDTGEIAQRLDYDVRVLADTNPDFQPFAFAGGLHDVDTGLVQFGARDYDPALARWTAKDPSGFAGGDTNLHAYAYGDPVRARATAPASTRCGAVFHGGQPSRPRAVQRVRSALHGRARRVRPARRGRGRQSRAEEHWLFGADRVGSGHVAERARSRA
jgi:RHS repeat-associated protein